jgi:succinate dehydrogenase flavin-adding protein (antitoxin of CptAB toxin-antitoxin module)
MVRDYAEDILQAVEIVVGKCLNDVAFDKTEICTIVSDVDKKNGHYTVTNGSARYDAYINTSNGAESVPEYKINDSVRVSVPNGNYSQKKYIIGLNITDNDSCPITYVSPLDTMLDMTDNIISGERVEGLRANDVNQSEWCLWSADCTQPDYRKLQNNSLYDTIAIRGDFKTLLTGYNVNSGSYGLRLDMYFKPTNGTDKLIKHSAYLDSSDMYGNPYSFLIYSTQAVKFSIANIGTIQTISLYFYQRNNFTYLTDSGVQEYLPVLNAQDPDYSNLLLRNVYLSFGSDIANINDNTVKLYTNEPLEYDRLADDESTNTKGVGLLWYNKNDAGQYLGFSDGLYDKNYDEIAYLELSERDSRLLAQQGKDVPLDENGLDLSADIVDAEKLLKKLKTSITQDLYQMLYAFRARIEGVCNDTANNNLDTYFVQLLTTANGGGTITKTGENLEKNTKTLVDYYLAKLSNARAKMDGEEYTPTDLTYTKPEDMMKETYALIDAIIGNEKTSTEGLLDKAEEIITAQYAGFTSILDSFDTKLRKLAKVTKDYADEFSTLMSGNDTKLNNYFKVFLNEALQESICRIFCSILLQGFFVRHIHKLRQCCNWPENCLCLQFCMI